MGRYTCGRCGIYTTDIRQNFWHHQNKTKKCGPNRTPTNTNVILNNKQCKYCNKVFSRIDSKTRHEKGRCKVKKEQDRQLSELEQAKLLLEREQARGDHTLNNEMDKNAIIEKFLLLERENEQLKKGLQTCNNVIKMLKRRRY